MSTTQKADAEMIPEMPLVSAMSTWGAAGGGLKWCSGGFLNASLAHPRSPAILWLK
jgi:hypothetical protein